MGLFVGVMEDRSSAPVVGVREFSPSSPGESDVQLPDHVPPSSGPQGRHAVQEVEVSTHPSRCVPADTSVSHHAAPPSREAAIAHPLPLLGSRCWVKCPPPPPPQSGAGSVPDHMVAPTGLLPPAVGTPSRGPMNGFPAQFRSECYLLAELVWLGGNPGHFPPENVAPSGANGPWGGPVIGQEFRPWVSQGFLPPWLWGPQYPQSFQSSTRQAAAASATTGAIPPQAPLVTVLPHLSSSSLPLVWQLSPQEGIPMQCPCLLLPGTWILEMMMNRRLIIGP